MRKSLTSAVLRSRRLGVTPFAGCVESLTGLNRSYLLATEMPQPTVKIQIRTFFHRTAGLQTEAQSHSKPTQSRMHRQYFSMFGLPIDVEVPAESVIERYRTAQMLVHPDKLNQKKAAGTTTAGTEMSGSSNVESEPKNIMRKNPGVAVGEETKAWLPLLAKIDSSAANVAYETLKNPFQRYKYVSRLLRSTQTKIKDIDEINVEALKQLAEFSSPHPSSSTAPSSSADDHHVRAYFEELSEIENIPMTQEFLLELMELNERVGDLDMERPEGVRDHQILVAEVTKQTDHLRRLAHQAWLSREDQRFHTAVQQWTYFHNLLQQLKQLE